MQYLLKFYPEFRIQEEKNREFCPSFCRSLSVPGRQSPIFLLPVKMAVSIFKTIFQNPVTETIKF